MGSVSASTRVYWMNSTKWHSEETVWFNGRVTERFGRIDWLLQQSSYSSRKNVLWQNANRNIRGWEINLGWKESSPDIIWQAPSRKVGGWHHLRCHKRRLAVLGGHYWSLLKTSSRLVYGYQNDCYAGLRCAINGLVPSRIPWASYRSQWSR